MNTARDRTLLHCGSLAAWLAIAGGVAAQESFDHFTTGFDLDGAHVNVPCESCHVAGRFEGTNPTCAGCHSDFSPVHASARPMGHIASSEACADCHTTAAWSPVAYMDHVAVSGSCGGCHNGGTATGKPPDHYPSSDRCDDCHSTGLWIPAVFDHATVSGNCISCHNGIDATGKDPGHVSTTDACEVCHSTTTWSPVATVDHTQVLGSCSSCHNGNVATGKNPGHFVTTGECNACHETFAWLPDTYLHAGLPYEPLDHRGNPPCTDCHQANSEVVQWPTPAYQPDCAGCHANDFRAGPHKKYENPDVSYTVGELRDCTGACHVYTDSSLTTIKDNRPGPEHRISGGDF